MQGILDAKEILCVYMHGDSERVYLITARSDWTRPPKAKNAATDFLVRAICMESRNALPKNPCSMNMQLPSFVLTAPCMYTMLRVFAPHAGEPLLTY